jgi:hypothetical protein
MSEVAHNRRDKCSLCGTELSYYVTKWVEQTAPHRIACFWMRDYKGCAEAEGRPPIPGEWVMYSDG